MNDFLLIACGAGLQDGLNPCVFMTCAAFIMHGRPRVIFALVYALGILFFNFGLGAILVYQKNFVFAAKILYFGLGLAAFVLGILFFKDWVLLRRGLPVKETGGGKLSAPAVFMTVFLAAALSALASLLPMNTYVVFLGSSALLKGQWQIAAPLLLSYVFFSTWALWFVWAFISIKNLRPSLLKIVYAAVFFTASSCMVLIFK